MRILLTYFKTDGKFYSKAELEFEPKTDAAWYEALGYVVYLQKEGELPGLIKGAREFHILFLPQDTPYNYPHLIFAPTVGERSTLMNDALKKVYGPKSPISADALGRDPFSKTQKGIG